MKKITVCLDENLLERFEWYGDEGIPRLDVDPDYHLEDMGTGLDTKSDGVGGVILAMAQAYMDLCDAYAEFQMYETNDEEDEEDEEDDDD
jgi:hypothetical protein